MGWWLWLLTNQLYRSTTPKITPTLSFGFAVEGGGGIINWGWTGCIITDNRKVKKSKGSLSFTGKGKRNRVDSSNLSGKINISLGAEVKLHENIN